VGENEGSAGDIERRLVTPAVLAKRIGKLLNDFPRFLSEFRRRGPTRGDTRRPV
jgi:hypothetical protein